MLGTIYFDNQFCLGCIKINDVITNRFLAVKMYTRECLPRNLCHKARSLSVKFCRSCRALLFSLGLYLSIGGFIKSPLPPFFKGG